MTRMHSEAGFSLAELLVATGLLLIVSAIVTSALLQMTQTQSTVWNRTEMHSGIRGATELLQQEVGQAGRVSLSATVSTTAAVAAAVSCDPGNPATNAVTVAVVSKNADGNTVTSVNGINPLRGMFATAGPPAAYMLMTTMDGNASESIKLAAVDVSGSTITACFTNAHLAGTVLTSLGGFANGVIPNSGVANGSTASVLKLFGDVNGDGNMVYVEYTCDTTGHNLYRNVMPFDTLAAAKPAGNTADKVLLSNVMPNPGGTPCFTYQTTTMTIQGTPFTFVLDVAITLTVQSEQIDPVTKTYQTETKALLNVSPRNVFNAWSLASIGYTDRIQSTPTTVTALLP